MLSFFALIPKTPSGKARCEDLKILIAETHPHYDEIMRTSGGMIILAKNIHASRACKLYTLAGKAGAIFGVLFEKDNLHSRYVSEKTQTLRETERIISSDGRRLIDNYWGRYTAFMQGKDPNSFVVVRDPTGAVPAYFYEGDDYAVFFSDSEDFAKLRLAPLTLNLAHILSNVRTMVLDYEDTGFHEIKKINRGQAAHINDGKIDLEQYWSPELFICRDNKWTAKDTMHSLRETVQFCVAAWALNFDRISVLLSGGLDSSIMLSCIRKAAAETSVLALTHYGSGPGEDERYWAKISADHTNTPLLYHRLDADQVDISIVSDFLVHAELAPVSAQVNIAHVEKPFADEYGIEATFLGEGGDGIFYSSGSFTAAEYLSTRGFNVGYMRQCYDEAHLRGNSFHRIFFEGLRMHFSGGSCNPDKSEGAVFGTIYNDELLKSIDMDARLAHWLPTSGDISLAKSQHIRQTRAVEFMCWPSTRALMHPRIQPLLSQPILELILSIPCHLFTYKGVSRGLARMAFMDLLPPEVIHRQSKGGGEQYLAQLYMKNLSAYRKLLIGGRLVELGICSNMQIEKALNPEASLNTPSAAMLLYAAGFEAWLRKWNEIAEVVCTR